MITVSPAERMQIAVQPRKIPTPEMIWPPTIGPVEIHAVRPRSCNV